MPQDGFNQAVFEEVSEIVGRAIKRSRGSDREHWGARKILDHLDYFRIKDSFAYLRKKIAEQDVEIKALREEVKRLKADITGKDKKIKILEAWVRELMGKDE